MGVGGCRDSLSVRDLWIQPKQYKDFNISASQANHPKGINDLTAKIFSPVPLAESIFTSDRPREP